MTFSEASVTNQNLICVILFTVIIIHIFLLLNELINSEKNIKKYVDIIIFFGLLILISFLRASYDKVRETEPVKIPYIIICIFIIVAFIYSLFGLILEYKRMKNNLSDNSIKEAFDNLNSGICFTDNSGRIVLINHVMNKLITELNGSAPQLLSDMKTEGLNVFSDGSSWEFHSAVLEGKEVQGFTKIIAQDVTEIYEVGERIKSENIHLRETNEELSKMYDILSDRIREEETLNLKMKVHNDIGRSLIALSEILENSESNIFNTENEMKKLRNAVSYFSNYKHEEGSKSLEEVKASAKELGITVYIEGDMPKDKHIEDAVTLAIAESVTNCYIHAKGSRVKVAISEKKVIITNDGITPSGEIKEGGGLSSLRKKLEKAGLLMKVYYKPEFKLEIIF